MQGLDSNCPSCSVARDKDQRHAPEMNSLQQGPRSVMNRKETTSTDVTPRNNSEVADRLPVVVRFPASPRVRLKTVDPPKGNGLGQKNQETTAKQTRKEVGATNETPTQEPPDLPWTRRETNWHCQWPSKQCEKSVQLPIKEAN